MLDLQFGAQNSSPALTPSLRFLLSSPEFKSSSKLGLPRPVRIVNPVKFDLDCLFQAFAHPTSITAINSAEGN